MIYTRTLVKVYFKGERVATHARVKGFGYTLLEEHTASHSNAYNKRSVAYYTQKAGEKSAVLKELFGLMFASQNVPPEFFYNRCDGLLRLQRINRRFVRVYDKEKPIDTEKVKHCWELATLAPNSFRE